MSSAPQQRVACACKLLVRRNPALFALCFNANDQVCGHKKEAREWYDKGIDWMEKNKEELKKDVPHREELQRFLVEAKQLLGLKDSSGSKK